ncbi:hypothetical protein BACPLE_00496 [Phocaeicola plebeius DSM 17135]|uniref:Uncharacterized protein n=1 Tax=Phocaeicola plebeius (strain DSM 17135 / JCM 12973 / CCUG 54634 / M2) TaxID=484018 RepID=B5CUX0_PHOPM|nr:hypothetical protein BACPLE_00496 [Phocaeicola plebeius DSM 17135]
MPASVSAPSAAGRFRFLLTVSFFPCFFPLLSFASLPLTRTAFRNAVGDIFSEKESHSSSEAPDTLRTGGNVSGKELVSGNMNLNHRADNFYSCNSKN